MRSDTPVGSTVAASETEIAIGFDVPQNLGPTYALLGARGISAADERKATEAAVNFVNKRGGLAGRQIVPVIHDSDYQSNSFSAESQVACDYFTQDHKVFAAVSSTLGDYTLLSCLAKRNVPFVSNQHLPFDDLMFENNEGFLYLPSRMNGTRAARTYADGLAKQGFFGSDVRLGLLRFDAPVYERITEQGLKPALGRHGVTLTEEVLISNYDSVAQLSNVAAQMSNAVLRLRTQNVNTVLFVDVAGVIPFFFLPEAESQAYRPRYGFHSGQQPVVMQTNSPHEQLRNAIGVGWYPTYDVDMSRDPGGNAARDFCKQALEEAGVATEDRTAETTALVFCEGLLFLDAGLKGVPGVATRELLWRSVERLGSRFEAPLTFGTRFGPREFDAPSLARHLRFGSDCGCFEYVSTAFPLK